MPAGRLRLHHAVCEFAAELETTPSQREVSNETQFKGPLCFDMPSSGRGYRTFPNKPPGTARWDEVTAHMSHFARGGRVDGAALTARISERGGLPLAFFLLLKTVDLKLTLALQTLVWPLQSEPDEESQAAEHCSES